MGRLIGNREKYTTMAGTRWDVALGGFILAELRRTISRVERGIYMYPLNAR